MGTCDQKTEERVRQGYERRDIEAMTSAILEGYGAEIYGFLVTTHGGFSEADDVFSAFSEALWQSLGTFELRCSARTWAYRIAHNISTSHFRAVRAKHEVPLSSSLRVAELVDRVRTSTASHLKTERKTELQLLREELSADERALLVLRIDRGLGWNDLSRIFLERRQASPEDSTGPESELSEKELQRESARLRQRFQAVKRKLRTLGKQRGLLHD